ncbi:MAG: SGNH/GDSL hydrolase family protein [Deltaproteobacteria bacterium]|nr:SGNH/GDSL hydrolase family protein [Deltaproteobacteria bacterium]
MHICFFGASVTKQDKDHQTRTLITGYVTQLEKMLSEQQEGYTVSRLASGSNYIGDAGITYIHKVVEKKPDICVLDWSTSGNTECSDETISFLYSELLSNRIWPITVVFPRRDRNQSETEIAIKQRQFCSTHNLPFLDLTPRFEKATLEQYVRDTVHTTEEGAIKYAEYLLPEIISSSANDQLFDQFKTQKRVFHVSEFPIELPHNTPVDAISISVKKPFWRKLPRNAKIKILMDVKIGPFSGFVEVRKKAGSSDTAQLLQTKAIYDRWCYYDRDCLKALTDWIEFPVGKVLIEQIQKQPDFIQHEDKCNYKAREKQLIPKGSLYTITNVPNLRVEYQLNKSLFD